MTDVALIALLERIDAEESEPLMDSNTPRGIIAHVQILEIAGNALMSPGDWAQRQADRLSEIPVESPLAKQACRLQNLRRHRATWQAAFPKARRGSDAVLKMLKAGPGPTLEKRRLLESSLSDKEFAKELSESIKLIHKNMPSVVALEWTWFRKNYDDATASGYSPHAMRVRRLYRRIPAPVRVCGSMPIATLSWFFLTPTEAAPKLVRMGKPVFIKAWCATGAGICTWWYYHPTPANEPTFLSIGPGMLVIALFVGLFSALIKTK